MERRTFFAAASVVGPFAFGVRAILPA